MSIARRIREAAARRGLLLGRTTDPARLRALIRDLRPEPTATPLIRAGSPEGDGGYLIPDDLDGLAACVSPGVARECSFDLDMARRGLTVHMADASVPGPPVPHPRFRFSPLFLDAWTAGDRITLGDQVAGAAPDGDLILQMDIEGAEWRVLNAAPQALIRRFRIVVLEAHALDQLLSPFGFAEIEAAFRKLLLSHRVVHIHPNNAGPVLRIGDVAIPSLMEFTFHRRDRAAAAPPAPWIWPHPLDRANLPGRPDLVLPAAWRPAPLDLPRSGA